MSSATTFALYFVLLVAGSVATSFLWFQSMLREALMLDALLVGILSVMWIVAYFGGAFQ